MSQVLLGIALLAIGMAGIAVKILFKKDGKFTGTCSTNNPLFGKGSDGTCSFCGARPDEDCRKEDV